MNNNVDPREIAQFEALAERWWDPKGDMAPLHAINGPRIKFVEQQAGHLSRQRVLDVGCGGGLLSEGLARKGAEVTGIDLAGAALDVAREHAEAEQLDIDYQQVAVETLAQQQPAQFDLVCCMEMLEHVPDPASIVTACSQLVRPGGFVILSTINRNAKAYSLAILGAEHLLRLIPVGTHQYAKLIKPSELVGWCRDAGLDSEALCGIRYNPFTGQAQLDPDDVAVNYLLSCRRPR